MHKGENSVIHQLYLEIFEESDDDDSDEARRTDTENSVCDGATDIGLETVDGSDATDKEDTTKEKTSKI